MAKLSLTKRELSSGELPLLCMKCGKTVRKPMKKTLVFWPRKVRAIVTFFGLIGGGILGLVAYFVVKNQIIRIPSKLPICEPHRNHWKLPFFVMFGSLLAFIVLMFGFLAIMGKQNSDLFPMVLMVSLAIGVIGAFVGLIMMGQAIWIESVAGQKVVLTNISEKFIAALIEHRESDEEAEVIDDDEGFEVIEEPQPAKKPRRNED